VDKESGNERKVGREKVEIGQKKANIGRILFISAAF